MNNDALTVIFSSNNESTNSKQPIVSLIEETELGIYPTRKANKPKEHITLKTNLNDKGVRKILPQDTLNKIRVILEDNPTIPPDIQQTKTPVSKIIKKNKLRTKTPINPFLYTKWVLVIKETNPPSNLQQKRVIHKLTNGGGGRTLEPS